MEKPFFRYQMPQANGNNGFVPLQEEPVYAPSWAAKLRPVDIKMHLDIVSEGKYGAGKTDKSLPEGMELFTKLDLFNNFGLSPETVKETLAAILGVRNSRNVLSKQVSSINALYKNSVQFLEKRLYRHVPAGLASKKWKSVDEFVEAIHHHTNRHVDGAYSLMFCAILKVMIVEADIDAHSHVVESLDEDMELLMRNFEAIPGLVRKKQPKGAETADFRTYELDQSYDLKMEYRSKSVDSIRLKEIYNRSYSSMGDFGDLFAARVELDPKKGQTGYVHTIRRLYHALYGNSKSKPVLEIKGGILTKDSIDQLRESGIKVVEKTKKNATDLRYEDAKFKGGEVVLTLPNGTKKRMSPEIQFVLPDNKNEASFSSHEVYTLKKVISSNARLFGGLTMGNLKYIFEKYPTRFDPRALLKNLFYPQSHGERPFLIILKGKSAVGKEKHYFTTSDVYYSNGGKATMADLFGTEYPETLDFGSQKIEDVLEFVHREVDGILRTRGEN
jgi:hypothetical protein